MLLSISLFKRNVKSVSDYPKSKSYFDPNNILIWLVHDEYNNQTSSVWWGAPTI